MGTNYYFIRDKEHIGKRSAAGSYCFDCDITLNIGGNEEIHITLGNWHNECPKCGKMLTREKFEDSTVGIELGFNTKQDEIRTGVRSCSSFTFAISPIDKRLDLPKFLRYTKLVKDEYGREFTMEEFQKILEACPIKFHHLIHHVFC